MNDTLAILDQFLEPISRCLSPEVVRELASFRISPEDQARVDELAQKANEGELAADERAEYEAYIDACDLIAILQTKLSGCQKGTGRPAVCFTHPTV